jgi:hypothetical protein
MFNSPFQKSGQRGSDSAGSPLPLSIIECYLNGEKCTVVFSKKQKQHATFDPIRRLNLSIQNLSGKIETFNKNNGFYDQNAQRLADEREVLVAKRAKQINQLHNVFKTKSSTNINDQSENTNEPPVDNSFSSFTSSSADELRKFKALLNDGILTQEEFDAKKKQLPNL